VSDKLKIQADHPYFENFAKFILNSFGTRQDVGTKRFASWNITIFNTGATELKYPPERAVLDEHESLQIISAAGIYG
jgi:hypothetical protein